MANDEATPLPSSADTPEEIQQIANGKDQWLIYSLSQIRDQIKGLEDRLSGKLDGLDRRLGRVEKFVWAVGGGVAVLVVIVGWVFRPILQVMAEKMISGG